MALWLVPLMAASAASLGSATAVAQPAGPVRSAQVVGIDGTSISLPWIGCCSGGAVHLAGEEGERLIPLDELSSIRFGSAALPAAASATAVFFLADGGRLAGELVGGQGDAIVAQTVVGSTTRLPFAALAGVQLAFGDAFEKSNDLFQSALGSRLPGQDVLVTRGPEDVKSLRGRLESLDAQQGTFVYADKPRVFQNDKIFGVVFALGVGKEASHSTTFELTDGSSFSGTLESADREIVQGRASWGSAVAVPFDQIRKLLFRSPRVTYVSDLGAAAERVEGRLHRSGPDRSWPVRRDRSVSTGPLAIDGRLFDKGLGVHSRTELDYDLDAAYEFFVATIGIDDAVRPLGRVVFRVLGDGRPLFDSGEVTGADAPREVRVEVKGVKRLTLSVDYGDDLDLSDHADWGGARLLKPTGQPRRSQGG